ncbi:hypothetical protein AALP_AA2G190400 [Arabis alpina]|uniref:AP2/ERF domain-containing protein n=1 Tax=Arabis alpina TaxID=50452 RepID=A0A087HIH9_ARAAL|nr:hypothetical protein AALP_AA2G190400 [Arabis alpina]
MAKKAMKKNEEEEEKRNNSLQSKYKGVRKRKWGKWVSEIRLPNSRERIWLGSYETPEKAARAFDAAQFCLRGGDGNYNFPDRPPFISGGKSLTPSAIQEAAARFANTEEESVVVVVKGEEEEESGLPGSEIRPESPSPSFVSEVATSTLDCDWSLLDMIPMDFGTFPEFDDFSDVFSGDRFTENLSVGDYGEENIVDDSFFLWDF